MKLSLSTILALCLSTESLARTDVGTLFERLNNKENNVHATRGLMTWKGKGASPSSKGSSSKGASPSSKGYSMSYKGKELPL
mmetsp:Transcript_4567/g.9560  ORF Transcript_4567/g.9560 Transcript_4567/m.9560 type:complete len:82 (+) Transcript_4567:116-361(+)